MAAYKSKINIEEENFEKNKSEMILLVDKMHDIITVSYTHLTLPTIYSV